MRRQLAVSPLLQSAYDEQYSDVSRAWREIGGKYKAENVLRVCRGRRFKKVLECGAGEGSILKFLNASTAIEELYAVELSDSGIEQIKKRELSKLKDVRKFDGYAIPYPDDSFDMVLCSHVIEHVEHPRVLLRELRRVSRFQVFEVPLDYSILADRNIEHFLSYGHISIYTPTTFRFLLRSEGYDILEEHLTHTAQEVERFNLYRNLGLKKTYARELKLRLVEPMRRLLLRLKRGASRHEEYGFSAYTCLAQAKGELWIFKRPDS